MGTRCGGKRAQRAGKMRAHRGSTWCQRTPTDDPNARGGWRRARRALTEAAAPTASPGFPSAGARAELWLDVASSTRSRRARRLTRPPQILTVARPKKNCVSRIGRAIRRTAFARSDIRGDARVDPLRPPDARCLHRPTLSRRRARPRTTSPPTTRATLTPPIPIPPTRTPPSRPTRRQHVPATTPSPPRTRARPRGRFPRRRLRRRRPIPTTTTPSPPRMRRPRPHPRPHPRSRRSSPPCARAARR